MKYNLSSICRTANTFYKKGYSRSTAFVLAWRLAKETAVTKISGVTYGNAQGVLAELAEADPKDVCVELRRDRDNLYDHNAVVIIATVNGSTHKLGYIPSEAARLIAPIMDMGNTVRAALAWVYGGFMDGMNYGAKIRLAM